MQCGAGGQEPMTGVGANDGCRRLVGAKRRPRGCVSSACAPHGQPQTWEPHAAVYALADVPGTVMHGATLYCSCVGQTLWEGEVVLSARTAAGL